ncbi:MAG: hypothetical protein FJ054_07900 [Cyanobacteria bacterium M_surface_10_m2_119]|nr:hypothetical protein [Cyanobacteria bacterium M_surface_10_m2_119]
MPVPLRFVVLKGVQGFGDRLQCLLQAIRYAEISRRHLVIDWRDSDWTHTPEQPLHTFFNLKEIGTYGLHEFQIYWQAHADQLSVFPACWAPVLTEANYTSWIYKEIFHLPDNNAILADICAYKTADFDADIVVYPGVGKRTFSYSDLNKLELSNWVKSRIQNFTQANGLTPGNYDIVHLRGGSKSWCGGHVPLKSLNTSIHERWPDQAAYLDDLWQTYEKSIAQLPSLPLVLLSDQTALAEAWQDRFSCGQSLPNAAGNLIRESGIHKLSAEDLQKHPQAISKEELTLESLRDFVVMLHARKVISDGISLFSRMAERCGAAGVRLMELSDPSDTPQG